jgi:hypothetical protein
MYARSLEKLHINRQFEQVIKESAIDCSIHKQNVRLEEMYTMYPYIDKTWSLKYINYSTGEEFVRVGVSSPGLPEGVFTLEDILNNTAKKSSRFHFRTTTNNIIRIPSSLTVSENISCDTTEYTFQFPKEIVNITINKELIPYLLKMKKIKILEFLELAQHKRVPLDDPDLPQKLKKFMNKKLSVERQKYIDALKDFGFSGEESLWDLYTLEELRKEYNQIK